MIKKDFLFSVIISQLTISCSSNEELDSASEESLTAQIEATILSNRIQN
jgi:hypothetical protein